MHNQETYSLSAENKAILHRAINTYGCEAQTDMAIEEMSELTKALLKNRRAEKSPDLFDYITTENEIAEEMADVVIMLWQLFLMHSNTENVRYWVDRKIKRLAERLDRKENEK